MRMEAGRGAVASRNQFWSSYLELTVSSLLKPEALIPEPVGFLVS